MPLKSGNMTRQERKFAEVYAVTGHQDFAARRAGYANPSGGALAIQRPAVQAEIRRVQTERLFSEALPAAVNCLVSIVSDERFPAGARVQASKVILDRTLGAEGVGEAKAPHEMTPDELQASLAKTRLALAALESAKADQARPIIEAKAVEASDIFE